MSGVLITLEGIEGSGKSTQMAILADKFSKHKLSYLCSREPGGTQLGGELRSLLLKPHPSGEKWRPDAELLLFYADRAQHLEIIIRPALAAGNVVLLDRFEDSTRAYQGAQGVPEKTLTALRQIVLKELRPDLTLLLDADPAKTLERVNVRNCEEAGFAETRFDQEGLDFHKSVRKGFLKIASDEPDRVRVIRADENIEEVAKNVWSAVASKLRAAGFL
ncbi:MAG: dTMP kinase [Holophagales bacterium]|nr:dTMP kinase [Holophagales bacterium]